MVYYMVLEKAHYKFNETSGTDVIDSSGNSNTGTIGAGITINQTGKINKSYLFANNDNTSNVNFGNLNWFSETNYSVCGWFNRTGNFGSFTNFLTKTTSTGYDRPLTISFGSDNAMVCSIGNGSDTLTNLVSTSTFSSTGWNHYCYTKSGNDIKLYINNSLEDSDTLSYTPTTNTTNILLGNLSSTSYASRTYAGNIDDFRIYDFVLTKKDINLIYNSGNGTETDLLTLRNRADFFSLSLGAEI